MAKFKLEDSFMFRNVNPGSLTEDNLITFAYASPNGVHDTNPLVIVTEKRNDRIYGINLHYTMDQLRMIVEQTQGEILKFLEQEYYKKYPENKKKLQEERKSFDKSLITEKEYTEMMRRYPKKLLEQFKVDATDMTNMRCYLYQRMTRVSKLAWKF